jgi:hypothetical protein
LYALRAYICLTDAYICSMYASGYTCLPVWVYIKTVIPTKMALRKETEKVAQMAGLGAQKKRLKGWQKSWLLELRKETEKVAEISAFGAEKRG